MTAYTKGSKAIFQSFLIIIKQNIMPNLFKTLASAITRAFATTRQLPSNPVTTSTPSGDNSNGLGFLFGNNGTPPPGGFPVTTNGPSGGGNPYAPGGSNNPFAPNDAGSSPLNDFLNGVVKPGTVTTTTTPAGGAIVATSTPGGRIPNTRPGANTMVLHVFPPPNSRPGVH